LKARWKFLSKKINYTAKRFKKNQTGKKLIRLNGKSTEASKKKKAQQRFKKDNLET